MNKLPFFINKGVKIYYEIHGEGPDLLLIHGFASNLENNWKSTNWVNTLKNSNKLILLDNRGHGKSDKPIDPKLYGNNMVEDVIGLLEHLSIKRANFFGYSMGARITLKTIIEHPEKIKCAIIGGFSIPNPDNEQAKVYHALIADALRAESLKDVKNPIGKRFRQFAESTGENLLALAAVTEGWGFDKDPEFSSTSQIRKTLKKIKIPLLSVCGSDDILLQNKTIFAELVPGASHFQIQGKDHLTVVPDPKFHFIVKEYLKYINKIDK